MERLPPVQTMLLHPSASVDDHFEAAAELLSWAHGTTMGRMLACSYPEEQTRELRSGVFEELMSNRTCGIAGWWTTSEVPPP